MDGKLEDPSAKFDDLTNIAGTDWGFTTKKNVTDIRKNFYNKAYRCISVSNDVCEYILGGKYSRFKATIFVPEGSNWSGTTNIKIIGDEKVLFDSDNREEGAITKTTDAFIVDIGIAGVDNFKILFSDEERAYIAHEGFYQ